MKKGFTLIELLIVIAIIGILATAFVPSILNAPSKARDAARIELVNKIGDYLSLKYAEGEALFYGAGYIKPGGTADAIAMLDVESFGGVIPSDPMDDWCVFTEDIGCAATFPGRKGSFFYNSGGFNGLGDDYTFAISAHVENDENGNNTSHKNPDTLDPSAGGPYYTYFGTK